MGTAYCIHEIFVNPNTRRLADAEVLPELARYEKARDATAADLRALHAKVASQVGAEQAAIFLAHESILHDPAFTEKIRHRICQEHQSAPAALHSVLNEYTNLFARTKDEYIKERLADVRDVVVRLSGHLSEMLEAGPPPVTEPLILVADELLPSQVVMLGEREVRGIVTQAGGQTSHAAILARSRGIPAVSGIRGMLKQVKNGDTIVVDGREGHVIVNPDAETAAAYRKLQREFFDLKDQLAENRDQRAVTADGVEVELLANINNLADAKAAVGDGRRRRRTVSHRISVSHASRRARRRRANRRLQENHRRQSESQGHDPHARPRRRQNDSLFRPCPRGESISGLAFDPPVVRASGIFRHANSRGAAGRGRPENGMCG